MDECLQHDHWHRWHTEGIAKPQLGLTAPDVRAQWAAFRGSKCSIENERAAIPDSGVHVLRVAGEKGLSMRADALVTGRAAHGCPTLPP